MMAAADFEAMCAAMLELAGRADRISDLWPGRVLWGAEEGGALLFCIAPPDAGRGLLADRFLDAILLAAHVEAAGQHVRRIAAQRAALTTDTHQ